MNDELLDRFGFSERHRQMMARDSEHVLGWRFFPRIVFDRGEGVRVIDVDGNAYYDLSSGMMSMVLGHAHPELVDCIQSQAHRLAHQASWYSNPWSLEYAELVASTLPGDLKVTNFAVTGSEANEIAMRMAIGATGRFELVSLIKGLHGGTLAVEALTTVGGARRKNLSPLLIPAARNAIFPPSCYRCPINLKYPECDIACITASEAQLEHVTAKEIAAIMAETVQVPGGMNVPPPEYLPRLKRLAEKFDALLVLDEAQLAPARTGKMVGLRALRRHARHRHLRQGDERRHGDHWGDDHARDRRESPRQGRRALGRDLFRRSTAGGGGAEAVADRAAR